VVWQYTAGRAGCYLLHSAGLPPARDRRRMKTKQPRKEVTEVMRMQNVKRLADVRRVLLIAVVLSIVWAAMGTAIHAAQGPPADKRSGEQITVLDPFSLRIIVVSNSPPGPRSISGAAAVEAIPKPPIRIPDRPLVRSAFRPSL